jgi:alpha(1,3/1,4) fucosyltransferase
MKRRIWIDFCDFWRHLDKQNNFFYNLLRERFELIICDRPDFLIYSNNGHVHRHFNSVKIYYTHEPIPPNFKECDYAFTSFHLDNPRHLRLPWYAVLYDSPAALIRGADFPSPQQILAEKTKFCSYVVSNHSRRRNRNRLEILEKLSKYKRVESGGRFMNNIGGPLRGGYPGKIAFMRQCKFHIAFENASLPGYTTEKLPQAMMARTLPIYWGNPRVAEDFNPRSFIDASDFQDLDALVERIIELDKDDASYMQYFTEAYLSGNKPTEWFDRRRLLDRFEQIFDTTGPSVTEQRRRRKGVFSFGRWMLVKRHDF